MTHHRRIVDSAAAPAAIGPYSQGVITGGLLFCSGQIALDPETGELVGDGDAGVQTRRCLANLEAVCDAARGSLRAAVKVTVYVTDLASDWDAVNEAYAEFFGDADPPARAAVEVAALPRGALVEIDAIVAL